MAKSDSKVIATIEVDIDIALNFLESQFPNPEVRWGELRSLIAKQKASEHKRVPDALRAYDMGEVNGVKLTYVNGNVFATPANR